MNRINTILAILVLLNVSAKAQPPTINFFHEVNSFLNKHIHDGLVDYQAIKKDTQALHKIVSALPKFEVEKIPDQNSVKAFWINVYNIIVIHSIISHYPLKSPMDVNGFFDKQKHVVAGETLTLNDIENIKLRKKFTDPRIHFVLVCGAKGCPPIINQAYTAEKLDDQLDRQTKANLNSNSFIRIDKTAKKVYVSEIFKWYKEDFLLKHKTILQYINQYRKIKIPANFSIDYYPYDWHLNDLKKME